MIPIITPIFPKKEEVKKDGGNESFGSIKDNRIIIIIEKDGKFIKVETTPEIFNNCTSYCMKMIENSIKKIL